MKNSTHTLFLVLPILLIAGIACSNFDLSTNSSQKPAGESKPAAESKPSAGKPAKRESYSIKGFKFAYYKIPAGLSESELIEAAQKIHDQEPDVQIILLDDDTELADYIKYAKAISGEGELDKPMPMEWADKHIVANIQKYTSGRFVLCKGYGSEEIADLK